MGSLFDNLVELAMKPTFDVVYGQPAIRTPKGGLPEPDTVQVILCQDEDVTPDKDFDGRVFDNVDTIEVRRSEVPRVFRDDVFTLQGDGTRWVVDRVLRSDGHHWFCVVTEL